PRCPGEVRWFSATQEVERGAYLAGSTLRARDDVDVALCNAGDLRVPGMHNVRNILAAAAVARSAGIPAKAIGDVARSCTGVEHRLEHVRDVDGISFLNDSIATSPERTVAALRALGRPVVLIAGGRSKHLPMGELALEIAARARAVVTMGEMAEE